MTIYEGKYVLSLTKFKPFMRDYILPQQYSLLKMESLLVPLLI